MKKIKILMLTVLMGICASCEKFLDVKPDQKLAVPATINDLRLILDTYVNMNNGYPVIVETMADNYYVSSTELNGLSNQLMRNVYQWQRDETANTEWTGMYMRVYYTNVVLEELKKLKIENDYAAVKGSAMTLQAYFYFVLAQIFAVPYQEAQDLPFGLPIRVDPDFNKPVKRASVHQTYQKIISLAKQAVPLLPHQETLKTRPTKAMAYGLLAKTYLLMKNYPQALLYADSALLEKNTLMNFNSLNKNASAPIARFNDEVIFHARTGTTPILQQTIAKIDTNLYRSYADNDLRKVIYFKLNSNGTAAFKGDYDGSGTSTGYVFWGLVTDEQYLIKAECLARQGAYLQAMETLNSLMSTRWKTGTFIPYVANNAQEAIRIVLQERRKELLFRGTRWSDLRRLTDDPNFSIVPTRVINGDTIKLGANSNRYTLPIPINILNMSNIPQNPL